MEPDPDPLPPNQPIPASRLDLAIDLLKRRKPIVYPTETFYGIMADAFCVETVEQILVLKGRAANAPLPCIIGNPADLSLMAETILPEHRLLMDIFWPGPVTLIFDAAVKVPGKVTAGSGSVGIRIPRHVLAQKLASEVGPLVATSANPTGKAPLTNTPEMSETFPGITIFDGGRLAASKGSTVLDVRCHPPKLIREGDVPKVQLQNVLGIKISKGWK